MPPLLEIRNLSIEFPFPAVGTAAAGRASAQARAAVPSQTVAAVCNLSFSIASGEVLGLVGESGSGKSITSLAIMRLLPTLARVSGEIRFSENHIGINLADLSDEAMRQLRGARMAMIFQEPMTALNPVMRVGEQIAEAALAHNSISKKDAWQRAVDAMNDAAFTALSGLIKRQPELTPQALNALIISRNLERAADHATNIAEDVIFWVRGSDVRHKFSLAEAD